MGESEAPAVFTATPYGSHPLVHRKIGFHETVLVPKGWGPLNKLGSGSSDMEEPVAD